MQQTLKSAIEAGYRHAASHPERQALDAYYTTDIAAGALRRHLPEMASQSVRILEPAAGAGALVPGILDAYADKTIDLVLVDMDEKALSIAKSVVESHSHSSVNLTLIPGDFLSKYPELGHFDLVVSNPPFSVSTSQTTRRFQHSSKIFGNFMEVALSISDAIAFIVPKSLLNAPSHALLRRLISSWHIRSIIDYGNFAFRDILIETIAIVASPASPRDNRVTQVESLVLPVQTRHHPQEYVCGEDLPAWVIYRNEFFDQVLNMSSPGVFKVHRDRSLTARSASLNGELRLFRARNIGAGYDVPDSSPLLIDREKAPTQWHRIARDNQTLIAVPNLSYYTRACFVPAGVVPDGSAAILYSDEISVSKNLDLSWFSTDIFYYFYRIARNFSVRTLNVDSCSVWFWVVPHMTLDWSRRQYSRDPRNLFRLVDSLDEIAPALGHKVSHAVLA